MRHRDRRCLGADPVLTGSAGSGKSTALRELSAQRENLAVFDFDDLRPPPGASPSWWQPAPTSSPRWSKPHGPRSGSPGRRHPTAKKKAIVTIAHTLLKIAYQVLKSGQPYHDLGAGYYTQRESPGHRQAWLLRQLEKLNPGATITITPPQAATPPEAALPPRA